MALQSSPSSSSSSSNRVDYDVFLNFRGSDTRNNFTGNLYKALYDHGVRTFIDDRELEGGEEITPALFKYIEKSRIFILVFSKNYASSSFCLDELVQIIDRSKNRLVLPIFYGVEPTHLRRNTGSYGEAIAKHEARFQNNKETYIYNMERLQKWKTALEQAADLSGLAFNLDGKEYEFEFIGKIIDFVSKKINRTPLNVRACRVGLEPRVLQVKSLLNVGSKDGVCIVGIHGMGGIGKTTLAKEIFNSIACQFEEACFLGDVRQKTLQNLQETLLHETTREKHIKLGSVSKGMSVIEQRLRTKKVLLILDDVDDLKQLEALVGDRDWFGPGSKIIVTTRDQHLLKSHEIEKSYRVEELNNDEALELLCWKAFRNNKVDPCYMDILNRTLTYASGLPLALEVVGSNLFGKHIGKWEPTLAQYKRNPCKDIQNILRVSFDALEKVEQGVFLDIACCFRHSKLKYVERILCAHHGHCVKYIIEVLVEKSLIKIYQQSGEGRVGIHDLIEDMGKDIVRQESPNEPGERSRLWFHKDIVTILEENTGTSKVEIIYFNCRSAAQVDWDGEAFKKMRNLKTLIINDAFHIHFSEDLKHFPNRLRVLELRGHPTSKFISSIFLSKRFENLTILKSDYNQYITGIPDVSGLPNLEIFSFRHCYGLITIHESVGCLSKLEILNVESCKKLKIFPPIKKLPSLQVLVLSKCSNLENFPEISREMKNITQLDLMNTSIKELPSLFQNLTGLCKLTIERVRLPIWILYMPKLTEIIAFDCLLLPTQNENLNSIESSDVKFLHLKNWKLTDEILSIVVKLIANVEELDLEGSSFTTIPECIKECHSLRKLSLDDCKCLREIRGIPLNLKYFSALGCEPSNPFFTSGRLFMNQKLHEDGGTDFCFPCGTERLPTWFEQQNTENIEITPTVLLSFWFRKSLPSVALYFNSRPSYKFESDRFSSGFQTHLKVSGQKYGDPLHLGYIFLKHMRTGYIYLFDARLQDSELESICGDTLLENKWIHVELRFERDDRAIPEPMWASKYLIEAGVHVFKEKTSMDDIRFTNPY